MLATLYKHFPKTRGRVATVSTSSPLTNEHYLGRAASYGLDAKPSRFASAAGASLRPMVGGVPGLVLTGQDLILSGWAGALISAVISTIAILLYNDWSLSGLRMIATLVMRIP